MSRPAWCALETATPGKEDCEPLEPGPFARSRVSVTGPGTLFLLLTSSLYGSYPSQSGMRVLVDGTPTDITFSADGGRSYALSIAAGAHTVDLIDSAMVAFTADGYPGKVSKSVSFESTGLGLTPAARMAAPSRRVVIYGDSISNGFSTSNPILYGWTRLLSERVTQIGGGGRALFDDVTDSTTAAAFAARLVACCDGTVRNDIVIAMSFNDFYGLAPLTGYWSAASFGTAYALLVDAIRALDTSVNVWAVTAIPTTVVAANSYGDTIAAYRSAVSGLSSGRAWLKVVDGTTLTITGNLSDGIHPTITGHAQIATNVLALPGWA